MKPSKNLPGEGGFLDRIKRSFDLIELTEADCHQGARDAEAGVVLADFSGERVEPVLDS